MIKIGFIDLYLTYIELVNKGLTKDEIKNNEDFNKIYDDIKIIIGQPFVAPYMRRAKEMMKFMTSNRIENYNKLIKLIMEIEKEKFNLYKLVIFVGFEDLTEEFKSDILEVSEANPYLNSDIILYSKLTHPTELDVSYFKDVSIVIDKTEDVTMEDLIEILENTDLKSELINYKNKTYNYIPKLISINKKN